MEHIDNIPSPVLFGEAWELKALFQQFVDINEAKRLKHSFYVNHRETPYVAEVKHAITERFYVGLYYEEEGDEVLNGFRLIEPYAYGLGYVHPQTKETLYPNRQYLRAYVVMDTEKDSAAKKKFHTKRTSVSLTDREPFWRLFRLDRCTSWFIFPKRFSRYREFYNPNDKMMRRVLTSNEYDKFPYGAMVQEVKSSPHRIYETTIYRGGLPFNGDMSKPGVGTSFSTNMDIAQYWASSKKEGTLEEFILTSDAKIFKAAKREYDNDAQYKETLVNKAFMGGFDGIDLSDAFNEYEIRIFNPNVVKKMR